MNPTDNPIKDIGPKLKKVRFDRGLTLDNVAEMTGVSKTMLGQIERGVSIPSITVLWKIAKGLRLSLSSLFNEEPSAYKPLSITEDMTPVYDENRGMVLYNIFPFDPVQGFEYFYIILKPGTCHHSEPHIDAVDEYVIVTKGTLTLELDGHRFTMAAPSKIRFHANIPHSYCNFTEEDVVFQNIMKY